MDPKRLSPSRIPPSLVPAGVKQQDLRNRLLRAGWERRGGRSSRHDAYIKGNRRFRMSFGTKNTRTIDRFVLADALSEARFTKKEVQELFS